MNEQIKKPGAPPRVAKIRIVNLTAAGIELPALEATDKGKGFPMLALKPGGNNVSAEYVEAVKAFTVTNKFGVPFQPHAQLFENHMNADPPRIRFDMDPGAIKLPEGPEPPSDLVRVSEADALEFVAEEYSVQRLIAWQKKEKREAVLSALFARIAKLS